MFAASRAAPVRMANAHSSCAWFMRIARATPLVTAGSRDPEVPETARPPSNTST